MEWKIEREWKGKLRENAKNNREENAMENRGRMQWKIERECYRILRKNGKSRENEKPTRENVMKRKYIKRIVEKGRNKINFQNIFTIFPNKFSGYFPTLITTTLNVIISFLLSHSLFVPFLSILFPTVVDS